MTLGSFFNATSYLRCDIQPFSSISYIFLYIPIFPTVGESSPPSPCLCFLLLASIPVPFFSENLRTETSQQNGTNVELSETHQ